MNEIVFRGPIKIQIDPTLDSGNPVLTRNTITGIVGKDNPGLSNVLTNGNIFVGNASNIATGVTPSGDISISNTGLVNISNSAITNVKVSAAAAIDLSKLASITANRVAVSNGSGVIIASSVGSTQLGYISTVSSDVQTQLNGKQVTITGAASSITTSDLTPNRVAIANAIGKVDVSTITTTVLGYIANLTSDAQIQINTKLVGNNTSATLQTPSGSQDQYTIVWDNPSGQFTLKSVTAAGVPNGGTTGQYLAKSSNADQATTWQTLTLSKITDVTASATEVNQLVGVTVTPTEFNFLQGVTSGIQTQINNKLTNSLVQNAIFVGNMANQATQLVTGIDGYVLTSVAGVPQWAPPTGGGGGVSDGDKGDITVSSGGTVWTNNAQSITFSKFQNIGTNRILGRFNTGTGSVEQITVGSNFTLSGGTLNFSVTGATGNIAFVNAAADGFDYSADLYYDSTNNKFIGGSGSTSTSGSETFTWGDNNVNNGIFGSAMFGELSEIDINVGSAFNAGENNYISAYGGHSMGRGVTVGGTYSWAGGWFSPSSQSGKTNLKAVRVTGHGSFGFYETDGSQTDNHGVLANSSAVLGGLNPNIPSDSPRSIILGGNAIKARATDPDQVYVPNFNIVSVPPSTASNFTLLVRDNTSGQIKTTTTVGSVTSVNVSGGTTGLSTSGGPITTTGTITIAGTLIPANGGTGLTTIGTSLQMIRVNAGATALEYFTPSISLATGTTGTDVNFGSSPVSPGGTITLNIPDASTTARGLITTSTQSIGGIKNFSVTSTGTTSTYTFVPSITATANSQRLTALDINPAFSAGAFTGTVNQGLLVRSGRVAFGTSTPGSKLQVVGEGTTSSTSTFLLQDSASAMLLEMLDDGRLRVGNASSRPSISPSTSAGLVSKGGNSLLFDSVSAIAHIFTGTNALNSDTELVRLLGNFVLSTGTQSYISQSMRPTINQTGTASGDVYGLLYNPTLTNINGRLFGVISAPSTSLSGFGTSTPNSTIHIAGSVSKATQTTSTDITLNNTHYSVFVDATGANRTISLPALAGVIGRIYVVKKTDASANTVTLDPSGAETIDGNSTWVLSSQYEMVMVQALSTGWMIIGKN